MLHAKPAMNAIVVQLLVDLSWIDLHGTRIADRNEEKLLQDRPSRFLPEATKFRQDQPLSRLLLTTFAYSKQKPGVACLCLINQMSVTPKRISAQASVKIMEV